ncbi:MAG: hypothetical protein L3J39_01335 [Verrucomicrobiales bacterium]|nr:hypothetical protein [Verrucomicrobiales bacterium]
MIGFVEIWKKNWAVFGWCKSGFLGLLIFCCAGLCGQAADQAAQWGVVMRHYRPYVKVDNMAKMYGFRKVEVRSGWVILSGAGAVLKAKLGSREFTINGLRYELQYPIEGKGRSAIVSVADLRGVMDLIFRPTSHMQPSPVRQILIENASGEGVANADVLIELLREHLRIEYVEVRVGTASGAWGVTLPGQPVSMKERHSGGVGGSLMLRVVAGAKGVSKDAVRCVILASAGAPVHVGDSISKAEQTVYAGNLFDAENLALATTVQGQIVAAKVAKDAGIRFGRSRALQAAHYPVIQLELGRELDLAKIAKLTAEGVKRYVKFIDTEIKKRESMKKNSKALLEIGQVELGLDIDLQGGEAAREKQDSRRLKLVLPISRRGQKSEQLLGEAGREKARSEAARNKKAEKIDPSQVEIQVFFFDLADAQQVHLIQSGAPEVRWISILPDWTIEQAEVVQFLYDIPPRLEGSTVKPERDLGYVIRVIHKGVLQDAVAQPKGLLNQLWNFTPIFPK